MKHRVMIDLSFSKESDARNLHSYALSLMPRAESINEGQANEEISYVDLHPCGHDENKPCEKAEAEREELIDNKIVTIGR